MAAILFVTASQQDVAQKCIARQYPTNTFKTLDFLFSCPLLPSSYRKCQRN